MNEVPKIDKALIESYVGKEKAAILIKAVNKIDRELIKFKDLVSPILEEKGLKVMAGVAFVENTEETK